MVESLADLQRFAQVDLIAVEFQAVLEVGGLNGAVEFAAFVLQLSKLLAHSDQSVVHRSNRRATVGGRYEQVVMELQ